MSKNFALLAQLILLSTLLTACTPVERVAYDTAVGSKAFLDSVKAKHPECAPAASIPPSVAQVTVCRLLNTATAAKDTLIDAGEAYCQVAVFPITSTTPCMPLPKGTPAATQAQAALKSALANYKQIESDLRKVA